MKFRFLFFTIGLFIALTGYAQNSSITPKDTIWDLNIKYAANGSKLLEIKVYCGDDPVPIFTQCSPIREDDDVSAPGDFIPGVQFGQITATETNGRLLVNWRTAVEQNSKEFVIEGSADGQEWSALGKLNSKSSNGTSLQPLDYSLQLQVPGSFATIGLSGLLLLTVARSRRAKIQMLVAMVALAAACSKKEQHLNPSNHNSAFIRVVQYDKDGTANYSKVIKVTNS